MSVLNQSGEEQVECPLCMEPLEVDDLHFYPCTCGYQICRFCWNRIREGENGLCPACRKAYPENPADFIPLSQEQVAAIKTEKKAREQKRRNKTLESRRALANVRVVQNNLVFVVGLPVRLADPEILKRQEYFGKYGKIHKVVINQSTTYAGSQGPSASAYVTYVSSADALRAIQGVNNVTLDGRVLKGSLGTTKYCANFMKNQPCPKPDCMYLHELGDQKASFTKEEMHAGLHQVYERKLHNQLLNSQRDKPAEEKNNTPGNSSTSSEKSSSKDGNQLNLTPTVVSSSHINIVNSSKSKKDTNGNNGNGNGSSSNGVGSNSNGKEAWPSLGSSPPSDSPARKQPSPKPQQSTGKSHISSSNGKEALSSLSSSPPSDSPARKQPSPKPQQSTVKSQENGTSESSSHTQLQSQPQAQTKNGKDHTENIGKTNRSNKDITNGQNSKKSKSDSKTKQKNSNSNHIERNEIETAIENTSNTPTTQASSVFDNEAQQNYLSNELNELESDRHSLLENHDLLENSDHSLLEDDNTHNLLNDTNNEIMMMQRHREMLAGLVDNNHLLPQMKSPVVNGYGLIDRDIISYLNNDRQISQINQGIMDQKELLLRERSRSEMLMRQNELLARQHNAMVEPKHYMPPSSTIGLESASEMLGANYHSNPNVLPPFGMRVDNSMATGSLGGNSLSASSISANHLGGNTMSVNTMGGNTMSANSLGGNTMSVNPLASNTMSANQLAGNTMSANQLVNSISANTLIGNTMGGYMLHNQQMLQQNQPQMQSGIVNGFDSSQSNEGRYLSENMDKFFTDFNKAQQMRLLLARGMAMDERRYQDNQHYPHNMLSAERLEMDYKQRMNNARGIDGSGRAAGDGDDDLDFDPFKETQKALAEMMETEMMQNTVSSGDNMERVRRSRLPPPGFSHANTFGVPVPRLQTHNHGFNTNAAIYSDWTQMDPAIMSTSVNFGKGVQSQQQQATLNQQQQELFARFNQLGVQPNGVTKLQMPLQHQWPNAQKMGWPGVQAYNNIPLPPGFSPAKPSQLPAEIIDAK